MIWRGSLTVVLMAGLPTCHAVSAQTAGSVPAASVSLPTGEKLQAQVDAYMRAAVANDKFTGAVLVAPATLEVRS